jgi:hypothetical protein
VGQPPKKLATGGSEDAFFSEGKGWKARAEEFPVKMPKTADGLCP